MGVRTMFAPGAPNVLVTVAATVFALSSLALGSTSITYADDPDLVMTIVSGPTSAGQGEQFNIFNRVVNQGTANTASSFSIGFYLSTNQVIDPASAIFLGSRTVLCCLTTITPVTRTSQTSTRVVIPSNVSPGTYYLGAYADIPPPDGVIAESDESNNSLASNISITISNSGGGGGTGGGDNDGGGCGSVTFGDDDHPHSGTVTGDYLVLFALLILVYVKRHRRLWTRNGTEFNV
jgi:hypothetical protein